jgi:hypothetical protein
MPDVEQECELGITSDLEVGGAAGVVTLKLASSSIIVKASSTPSGSWAAIWAGSKTRRIV